jgi:hypothetical protein
MNTINARPLLALDLRVSTHDDGAVILDIDGGQVYSTNKVGARILVLLGESKSLNDIADAIKAEFDAPIEQVRTDLDRFVQSLSERGLLQK